MTAVTELKEAYEKYKNDIDFFAEIYVVRLGDHFLCITTVNHWRIMKGIIDIFLM